MTVKGVGVTTYKDIAAGIADNGKTVEIVEMCHKTNAMMEDMLVKECNNGTNHKTTIRTGLPRGTWRRLNYGVPQGKTTKAEVQDTTGMLEIYSEVDKEEALLSGNPKGYRMEEAKGIMEGLNQQMQETLIYGNEGVTPAEFTGVAPRYNTLLTTKAATAENVISMGGAGANNTSIWLLTWGDRALHGLYPKGTPAGFQHSDLGEVTLEDANKGKFQGYRDHFVWRLGISLRDWRKCGRLCNIDVGPFLINFSVDNMTNLISRLIVLQERVERGEGNRVFYMNKTMYAVLRLAILNKVAGNLTWESVSGKKVMVFDDTPVRQVDALLNTEAVVV